MIGPNSGDSTDIRSIVFSREKAEEIKKTKILNTGDKYLES
jgi:hypothetical protein